MKSDNLLKQRADRVWLTSESCDIEDFKREIAITTKAKDYPLASGIAANVPTYLGGMVRQTVKDPEARKALLAEWSEVLLDGPGILVFKNAFDDLAPLDAASRIFNEIIEEQHVRGTGGGDHFAKPGANDRIWNALEKLAIRNPEVFASYYANEIIALISESWLGPGYQITSQLNVVNPGGQAQSMHRDYHMGFQTEKEIERYPAHAHQLSPVLTLQGAVAHVDMPVETGPTQYLPYSQKFVPGYFAYRKPEFQEYFKSSYVQLPLEKGDAVFFNPALYHAAGTNSTKDVKRMANLLQVSSAYGRAMETVDRHKMSRTLYPVLRTLKLDQQALKNVVAACAEGYAFPTDLDRDPPIGGLAPQSQAQLMLKALDENWDVSAFNEALERHSAKRLS